MTGDRGAAMSFPEPTQWNGDDDRDFEPVEEQTPDFRIYDHGTVVGFEPLTAAARHFIAHGVETESWQWMGDVLLVDHRPAQDLLDAITSVQGFRITLGGA